MPWAMRCSFSMRAKRTKPSPPGPKPMPGDMATSQSRTSSEQNSTEVSSAYGSGIGAHTNIVPFGFGIVPPDARQPVDQRVAPGLVDRA